MEQQRNWRWGIAPLIIAWASFLAALVIWGLLGKELSLALLGTALGLGGFLFGEITYAHYRHPLLREMAGLLIIWWLFLSPMMVRYVVDVTGLYRLVVLVAEKLGNQAVVTFAYYAGLLWLIPAGFFHLWADGKTKLNTEG